VTDLFSGAGFRDNKSVTIFPLANNNSGQSVFSTTITGKKAMKVFKYQTIQLACLLGVGLSLSTGQAAAVLVTWNINGTITGVNAPYLAAGWAPTVEQQLASQNALAPFSAGSLYTAKFVVDLNAPYTPASGVASFEGSIKSFDFSVPSSGYSYTSSNSIHQGVSILPGNPQGDAIYFYLPTSYSFTGSSTDMLASFFFIDPNGSLNASPDLNGLYTSFDTSKYSFMSGSANLYNSGCLYRNCGSLEFSISNATVSAVPVPAAAWLLGSGLLGLIGVARKRKAA
jgi:hypothetical protein